VLILKYIFFRNMMAARSIDKY